MCEFEVENPTLAFMRTDGGLIFWMMRFKIFAYIMF